METPQKLDKINRMISFLEYFTFTLYCSSSLMMCFRIFNTISITIYVIDAIKKRYKAIDKGGINCMAISTNTKEKPQMQTIKNRRKYLLIINLIKNL